MKPVTIVVTHFVEYLQLSTAMKFKSAWTTLAPENSNDLCPCILKSIDKIINMKKTNWQIFYPILLGIYPAVGLVSVNISQMVFSDGIRSILVTIVFSLLSYSIFCWRIKDEHKAALLCAVFMLFFFAYGHVYGALAGIKIFGVVIGRHRFVFPIWLILFGALGYWIFKLEKRLESISKVINTTSVILMIIPVIQIGIFEWQRNLSETAAENAFAPTVQPGAQISPKDQLPDVYYIILDGYPRQDVLLQYHGFDNSDFINRLQSIGFYVPSCSQSNYSMTDLSLATSLNMNYLEGLNPNIRDIHLSTIIIDSKIRQFLKGLGYKIVSFESGIWFTEFKDADYYIYHDRPVISSFFNFTQSSEFEFMFVRTTVLRLVEEFKAAWLNSFFKILEKKLMTEFCLSLINWKLHLLYQHLNLFSYT